MAVVDEEASYIGMSLSAQPKGERHPRARSRKGGAVRRRFALLNAVADNLHLLDTRATAAAWLLLFRHANASGAVTASVADLARRARCDESTMRRSLKRLRLAGLLEREKRGTLAGGPSVWRLLTPEGERP